MNKIIIILLICFLLVFSAVASADETKEDSSFLSKIITFFKKLFRTDSKEADSLKDESLVKIESQVIKDNVTEEISSENIGEINITEEVNIVEEPIGEVNMTEKINITEEIPEQETEPEEEINETLLAEIEQCKEDLKDEDKVYDYENVCECSALETDICFNQIGVIFNEIEKKTYWETYPTLFKELCVCLDEPDEQERCESYGKPLTEDAYIFDYVGSTEWSVLQDSINNYCEGYNAITHLELEDEDDDFFYVILELSYTRFLTQSVTKTGTYLKFSKYNSTYYIRRESLDISSFNDIFISEHGMELQDIELRGNEPHAWYIIPTSELKDIIKYNWVKEIRSEYVPVDLLTCTWSDHPYCKLN